MFPFGRVFGSSLLSTDCTSRVASTASSIYSRVVKDYLSAFWHDMIYLGPSEGKGRCVCVGGGGVCGGGGEGVLAGSTRLLPFAAAVAAALLLCCKFSQCVAAANDGLRGRAGSLLFWLAQYSAGHRNAFFSFLAFSFSFSPCLFFFFFFLSLSLHVRLYN